MEGSLATLQLLRACPQLLKLVREKFFKRLHGLGFHRSEATAEPGIGIAQSQFWVNLQVTGKIYRCKE